jgi:hypothetical protein
MPPTPKKTGPHIELEDWFTVSYRSIYMGVGLVALVVLGIVGYRWYPRNAPATTASPGSQTDTTARFTSVEGSVQLKAVGSFDWLSADKSTALKKGDLVRTRGNSSAEITFFDGTVVHVRPDSLITIEETSEDPTTKQRRVSLDIKTGDINLRAGGSSAGTTTTREIVTNSLRATAPDESQARYLVDQSGQTEVKVFKGTQDIRTKQGETVALATNQAVRVDPTGRAAPKVTLPAPPGLSAPQHQAEISYPDATKATTLFIWKPVAEAAFYHLVIDQTAYFNQPILDRKDVRDSSVEIRGLEPGRYYWRVAAVNKDGAEGAFSEFARFTLTRPQAATANTAPPPPLTVDSLDVRGNIVQIKGRTEPGARVTVNGQRVDVQQDGTFNEFITLEKTGRQDVVVRSTGLNGGVKELRRPVMAGE